ncbi:MAG: citrate synthase [Candidatus Eremiobacteraeota bacterium]|nr:citrate synthase [Candidatus Eremiobacteraeota bacterium]MCW5867417.1 citrate synthase [Candidatus Eremiobacteraeota bacterium]
MSSAKFVYEGKEIDLPVITGSMGEVGVDISKLRSSTGAITMDLGYGNTGSCQSEIAFIDGEKGVLLYRGYPIEEMVGASFLDISYMLIYGQLPSQDQLTKFRKDLDRHQLIPENMKKILEGYPNTAHPMAILSSMVSSLSAYHPDTPEEVENNIVRLMAKLPTICAFSYKQSVGQPHIYPRSDLTFAGNFLHMMFATPCEPYQVDPVLEEALNMLLILHADHEQNCSTSTVRMVGSSGANLFASIAAGVCALWGPLHGGANQEVIEMLEMIQDDGANYQKYVDMAKDKKSGFRLFGFGHRVYKNFDPRARILKVQADKVLERLGINDPLLEIAQALEEVALKDSYFVERSLYPNVDFYSGIIYRAMGIPTNMFTVMFALGRLPGWIAQWRELHNESSKRICRPRQIYTGEPKRAFVPLDQR